MNELLGIAKRPATSERPGATVLEAGEAMLAARVGALAILEEGRLVGILSERDILARVVVAKLDPAKTLVSEVMTREVCTANAAMTIEEAMNLMHNKRFRHLPVLDDQGKVVGMLSVRHLLRHRVEQLDRSSSDIVAYLAADGPGG